MGRTNLPPLDERVRFDEAAFDRRLSLCEQEYYEVPRVLPRNKIEYLIAHTATKLQFDGYGDVYWNPDQKEVHVSISDWHDEDAGGASPVEQIEKLFKKIDGVSKVGIEAEAGPNKKQKGWVQIEYKFGERVPESLKEQDPGKGAVITKGVGGKKVKPGKPGRKKKAKGSVWKTKGGRYGAVLPSGQTKYYKSQQKAKSAAKPEKKPEPEKPAPVAPTDPGKRAVITKGVKKPVAPGKKAIAPGSLTPDQQKQLRKAAKKAGLRDKPATDPAGQPDDKIQKAIARGKAKASLRRPAADPTAPPKPGKPAKKPPEQGKEIPALGFGAMFKDMFKGAGARAKGAVQRAAQSVGDRLKKMAASQGRTCNLTEEDLVIFFASLDEGQASGQAAYTALTEAQAALPELDEGIVDTLYQIALTRWQILNEAPHWTWNPLRQALKKLVRGDWREVGATSNRSIRFSFSPDKYKNRKVMPIVTTLLGVPEYGDLKYDYDPKSGSVLFHY